MKTEQEKLTEEGRRILERNGGRLIAQCLRIIDAQAAAADTKLDALREQLAAQGLHVVTDADKAVLDAMARIPEAILRDAAGMYGHLAPSMDDLKAPVRAEIARRGLK